MIKENQKPKACVGVMTWKEGKVLIGQRTKNASHGPNEYCFPGGHMESGESFKDAVQRETSEETGIKIKNLRFSCVANIDKFKNHQVVLVCMIADWESGEPQTFSEENIGEWQWREIDDLPEPLFYPTKITVDSYKTGKNYYDKE